MEICTNRLDRLGGHMITIERLKIDWLKQNHQAIHYFGLGFIQVKLNNEYRLHFYCEELPPIIGEEEIHNHRYNFTSVVLKGQLIQDIFQLIPGDKYILEDESCQEGCHPTTAPTFCDFKLLCSNTYNQKSDYFIDHETFHRVNTDNCITMLSRSPYKKEFAKVARLKDAAKICPFSQKIAEPELWQIVEHMLVA